MPIVKANAYGHGLSRWRACWSGRRAITGVAFLEEGMRCGEGGIKCPILVLGGILGDQIPLFLGTT